MTPNGVNTNIKPRYGGNNFNDTFTKVNSLVQKYKGVNIKFIFMTDGGCSFPSAQVQALKTFKNTAGNNLEYYGI